MNADNPEATCDPCLDLATTIAPYEIHFQRLGLRSSAFICGFKEVCLHYSIAAVLLARSRSRNFWILPVEVLGSGPKITVFGALKRAMRARQNSMISSTLAEAPSFSSMNAHGVSPHLGSGCATTAAIITAGWPWSTSSTSCVEMFSPPEMITSFERSLIFT